MVKRMKKRPWIIRVITVVLVLTMICSLTGCVERYYNGKLCIVPIDDEWLQNKVTSACDEIQKFLENQELENLLILMPEEATEEEKAQVTSGYEQYQTLVKEHGEVTEREETDFFYFCYQPSAEVQYTFADGTVWMADVITTSQYRLKYLDFYPSQELSESLYQLPEGIVEETVTITANEEFPLEGTLTYPEGGTDLPAVLLVQGVGSSDRDQTAYATKMMRDIANSLAQQGIAVLRFDRRLYTYPDAQNVLDLSTLTVDFSIVEDAVEAAAVLAGQEMVDPEQVYLVAHDLGGLIAPRIDAQADFAGYCLLGAPCRDWSEAAYDQLTSYGLNGQETEDIDYIKAIVDADIEEIREVDTLGDDVMTTTVLNYYLYYWKDLNSWDYPAEVAKTEKKVMIAQGEEDYQIVMEKDYVMWQELLAGKENVTFKSYANVNHMMMDIEGPYGQMSRQYKRPLHVSTALLDDIASWIFS